MSDRSFMRIWAAFAVILTFMTLFMFLAIFAT